MKRPFLLCGLVVAAVSLPAAAQDTRTVEGRVVVLDPTDRRNPPPVSPITASGALSETLPKGVSAPKGVADPRGARLTVGKREIVVVVGKSKAAAEHPDVLCVDLDGDGSLGKTERLALSCSAREQRGTNVVFSEPVDGALAGEIAFQAQYSHQAPREPMIQLRFLAYFVAETDEGRVAILDQDLDGTYGSAGDLWTLAEAGGRPASAYALSAIGERVFQDGHRIGIAVKGRTVTVTRQPAAGPDPADAAAHRIRVEHLWAERFDAERSSFVAQRGLDTSRPLAKQPVEWQYVTFEEAIALGKKAGKPVFVDVMAFWCVWCYRMDYYTYPDLEVARMLQQEFVPVKIIQEQDLVGDYDLLMKEKIQARGIPAMGVFDGEGKLLHKIGGWKKPEDFLVELRTAKQAFAGR